MHHGILVKVHGSNVENAKDQLAEIMEQTLACEVCHGSKKTINWDYFSIVDQVTDDNVTKFGSGGAKTVEEKIQYYKNCRLEKKNVLLDKIRKDFDKTLNKPNEEITHTGFLSFYAEELESLLNVIEFEDGDNGAYTLHCTDNHYANLEKMTEGDNVFYFWVDRHY